MVSRGKIVIPVDEMDADAGSITLQGVFYFDFDQAIVRRDAHRELDQHAGVLADNLVFVSASKVMQIARN